MVQDVCAVEGQTLQAAVAAHPAQEHSRLAILGAVRHCIYPGVGVVLTQEVTNLGRVEQLAPENCLIDLEGVHFYCRSYA